VMKKWVTNPLVGLGYHAANFTLGVYSVALMFSEKDPKGIVAVLGLAVLAMFFTHANNLSQPTEPHPTLPPWFGVFRVAAFLLSLGVIAIFSIILASMPKPPH